MLSEADAQLAERDPAIPGLRIVLDPQALSSWLNRVVRDAQWRPLACTYLKYKPGTSCLVSYRFQFGNTETHIQATAYRRGDVAKFDKARRPREHQSRVAEPDTVVDEGAALIVSFFPNDRRMPTLRQLDSPDQRKQLLRKALPKHPELWGAQLAGLAYKPHRRYVGQLLIDNEPRAVVKAYTREEFSSSRGHSLSFSSQGPLRTAKRLGHSNRHRVQVFDWQPGLSLSGMIRSGHAGPREMAMAGHALGILHRQDGSDLPAQHQKMNTSGLEDLAATIAHLCPEQEEPVRQLALRLANRWPLPPQLRHAIHGDLYADQLLVHDGIVGVIDFDEAVLGDPSADLGNFIAHLDTEAIDQRIAPHRIDGLAGALLDGYDTSTTYDPDPNLAFYRAASLMRLAPHCFRQRQADWPKKIEAVVERAHQILTEGPKTPVGRDGRSRAAPVSDSGSADNAVTVSDPLGAVSDPSMPFLTEALNPSCVQHCLEHPLSGVARLGENPRLTAIRVVRHKPAKRCLIEYGVSFGGSGNDRQTVTLLGKTRAWGLDYPAYAVQTGVWNHSQESWNDHTVMVPEPIGTIPQFRMWLQRKVVGQPATGLLTKAGGVSLAKQIAHAIHGLHEIGVPSHRRPHTIDHELQILHQRLAGLGEREPRWAARLDTILAACDKLGGDLRSTATKHIHRDFYADQVLVDGSGLYLVDFDLYCQGDPGLDVGNFLGHLTEHAVRFFGDPFALADQEQAAEDTFIALAGEAHRPSVRVYALLTLVRHIYISTLFENRRPFTPQILDLCEERLLRAGNRQRFSPVST